MLRNIVAISFNRLSNVFLWIFNSFKYSSATGYEQGLSNMCTIYFIIRRI